MGGALQTLFPAMGTVNSILIYDPARKNAAEEIRFFVRSLDRKLSVFRPDSEISRFNALDGGEWMTVGEDSFAIFRESIRCSRLTGGAFDVTAGPLSALWREAIRSRRLPEETAVRKAGQLVNYRDLGLKEEQRQVCLQKKEQSVDFGGIAKGYAADRAVRILREAGVKNALINFGGTVGVLGEPKMVGIQDPFRPTGEPFGVLTLQDSFAVTSGSYERGFARGGVRWHHIIDPRTGMPSDSGLRSVTLVGTRAAELDALSTAVFILGAEAALPLLQSRALEAVFITETGQVLVTPGLQSDFRLICQKGRSAL
ncbi:MAG: FAD:protein FMN transferase [Lachnospiraceae bacterium]|nr:FAD:protein FMN transferase [Lachnospiraceae bacterium]